MARKKQFDTKDYAYRGYVIKFSPFNTGETWIEKSGFHIGYAKDETDARRIIDELAD